MQLVVASRWLMEKKRSLLIRFSVCRSVKGGSLRQALKKEPVQHADSAQAYLFRVWAKTGRASGVERPTIGIA